MAASKQMLESECYLKLYEELQQVNVQRFCVTQFLNEPLDDYLFFNPNF